MRQLEILLVNYRYDVSTVKKGQIVRSRQQVVADIKKTYVSTTED
jgi:hypothetical protein